MLPPILIRKHNSITNMFLKRRVNNQLLTNRVPGQLPSKQILELRSFIHIRGLDDAVVVGLDLAVVLLEGIDDARSRHDGGLGDGTLGYWEEVEWGLVEGVSEECHCGLR